jgi:hypothetical protein
MEIGKIILILDHLDVYARSLIDACTRVGHAISYNGCQQPANAREPVHLEVDARMAVASV